ncbi:DNA double-strand break repair nuclease NurA [Candidatus Woesearchaeota archaeon]|nr:DNA double-strand break repair nuclease NurA [Candidatus Woesearchaeota archaeon]
MNPEIINKIVESLTNDSPNDAEAYPYFSDKSYKTFRIEKKNFNDIKKSSANNSLCFIDGGNTELLQSANNSLQLIRVHYTTYKGNKRIKSKKFELFALITAEERDGKVLYKTRLFDNILNINEADLIFDPFDPTIKTGIHQIKISRIGGIARRFCELKLAETMIDGLEKDDVIILDGFLQSSATNEKKYLDALYKKSLDKGIIVSALSKTSTLLTTKGHSISNILDSISPNNSWYYYPVAEANNPSHQADIFFIKLNEKSRYTFRFELYKKQKYDINAVLNMLARNSKDPVFLGYPYGLIEADRFARVSNQEKEYLKMILHTKLKDKWSSLNSLNAHDILDNI